MAENRERILPLTREALTKAAALEAISFPDPWTEPDLAQLTAMPAVRGWATWRTEGGENVLAAYCLVQLAADEGEILRVAAAPAYRGQGIAVRLLADIFRTTAPETAHWFLEVREGNTPARALYAKLGFQTAGIRKNYYRDPTENALILRRES